MAENDKNRVSIITATGLRDVKDKYTVKKYRTKEVRYRVKQSSPPADSAKSPAPAVKTEAGNSHLPEKGLKNTEVTHVLNLSHRIGRECRWNSTLYIIRA